MKDMPQDPHQLNGSDEVPSDQQDAIEDRHLLDDSLNATMPLPLESDPACHVVVLDRDEGREAYVVEGLEYRAVSDEAPAKAEAAQLRDAFISEGRTSFIKSLVDDASAQDSLRAIFGSAYPRVLAAMCAGLVPAGFTVCHIIPIQDGGQSDPDNLVLVDAALKRPLFQPRCSRGDAESSTSGQLLPHPKPGVKVLSRRDAARLVSTCA